VNNKEGPAPDVRTRETRVFVFLTVVLAPALAVALVGAYGLAIWVYQMLMGPPKG
jgi:periplasmic nitrate reductase NapE